MRVVLSGTTPGSPRQVAVRRGSSIVLTGRVFAPVVGDNVSLLASGPGKTPPDDKYNQEVADAIKDAGEILIVGPSTAKLELFKYLQKHAPAIAARVVSVETVDHPTDGQLVKFARRHYEADDRMRPQI